MFLCESNVEDGGCVVTVQGQWQDAPLICQISKFGENFVREKNQNGKGLHPPTGCKPDHSSYLELLQAPQLD
jgi:hypothetical protein